MPSSKPRLILTLAPELQAAIDDLAEASGKPRATVVVELLGELTDQMHDLAKLMRHAKAGNRSGVKKALRDLLGGALAGVLDQQLPLKLAGVKKAK